MFSNVRTAVFPKPTILVLRPTLSMFVAGRSTLKENLMKTAFKRLLRSLPLGLALALAGAVGVANATPLPLNVPTSSVDTVSAYFGGTLLDSATTSIANVSYTGLARSAVYDTGSGLDFYYQFVNEPVSVNGVARFTAFDFAAATQLDVFQTGTAFGIFTTGTETADYADRTALGIVGFNFIPNGASKVNPGKTSFIEIIRTNARNYKPGTFGLLDGIGDNAAAFAPAGAVPEPGTYVMTLAGLLAIGVVLRRRASI
jgi:hypothetical protein